MDLFPRSSKPNSEDALVRLGMNEDVEEIIKRFGMSATTFGQMAVTFLQLFLEDHH